MVDDGTAHVLWCAAATEKVARQWAALIERRSLPQGWLTLLLSGIAPNESLHTELSSWWKNSPEQFPTTPQLHLTTGQFGTLLVHSVALYSPTSRQVGHDQVLALALRGIQFTGEAWQKRWPR